MNTATTAARLAFDIPAAEFRARYFEQDVRLQKAALRGQPFGWSDLDQVLAQLEPGEPVCRLFNQGLVPEPAYIEDCAEMGQRRRRFNKARFYGQLRSGATLVIDRFENVSIAARRLCAEVASFAGLPTLGNGYLSCGGRGTFGIHWDTHDVFAIQLLGRKRWQVFAPTFPLPLSHHRSEGAAADGVTRPVLDCVLEAGDVLYVPRGWWHQTLPLPEGSFHLSVGTYAATVYDYFMWACSRQLPGLQAARAAFDVAAGRGDVMDELLRRLSAAVRDPALRQEFQKELMQRERLNSEFRLGLFVDPAGTGLHGQSLVGLTSCYPQGEQLEVCINGGRLRLDPLSHAVVNALRPAALPFDVLCARLGNMSVSAAREQVQRAVLDLAQHEVVTILG